MTADAMCFQSLSKKYLMCKNALTYHIIYYINDIVYIYI